MRALGGPAVARIAQGGTVHGVAPAFRRRHGPRPWPKQESLPEQRRLGQVELLVAGWPLFALTLGVGVLVGWAIRGA